MFLHLSVSHSVWGGASQHAMAQQYIGKAAALVLSLSWCGDSIQVTSNALWDRSHGTLPRQIPIPRTDTPSLWADTPQADNPSGRPLWADTPSPLGSYPRADTPLGRHPLRQRPPLMIWSMSGWYASYWNALLF